jgi:hypothetical protein
MWMYVLHMRHALLPQILVSRIQAFCVHCEELRADLVDFTVSLFDKHGLVIAREALAGGLNPFHRVVYALVHRSEVAESAPPAPRAGAGSGAGAGGVEATVHIRNASAVPSAAAASVAASAAPPAAGAGATFDVTVSVATDTLARLKAKVAAATGVKAGDQTLYSGTTALRGSSRTLASLNVKHDASLKLCVRPAGGGAGLLASPLSASFYAGEYDPLVAQTQRGLSMLVSCLVVMAGRGLLNNQALFTNLSRVLPFPPVYLSLNKLREKAPLGPLDKALIGEVLFAVAKQYFAGLEIRDIDMFAKSSDLFTALLKTPILEGTGVVLCAPRRACVCV